MFVEFEHQTPVIAVSKITQEKIESVCMTSIIPENENKIITVL